ncbi:aminopeptidase N [Flocculibacter collagenilyticus]|uniref:aminopeptidase N n=1 Tax=Flocculibacter collagenilyticus TaxID=2744479 RepID=UPI0018F3F8AE|nr:aminopeptidase N [Flocculibacter collagenilyticus]
MTTEAKYLKDYRQSDFLINHIDLTFELDDHQTVVTAVSQIERVSAESCTLELDGHEMELKSIAIDGKTIKSDDYRLTDEKLYINTGKQSFTLTIVTHIDPANNKSLEGLYKSGGAYCTQCEAEGFRKITYYLDRPDVMAKFTTKIIGDAETYPQLLSNGNKVGAGKLDNGKHWVQWEDPFKKPCYLFALVAGDFDLLSDTFITCSGREVQLEIYVDKGNRHKATHAMASLKKSMQWDEEVYGLEYDLDIYMIVAVDFFNMGAMENKGLNIFNSKYVLASEDTATDTDFDNVEAVIAHEYFHNWTGNRITCRDWFQLSLKEGLTVFRDQEFSADMGSRAVNRIHQAIGMRTVQFKEDASPMSHPIRPEKVIEMNNFYTVTVYEKGAEVIRMLYRLLGKDNYYKGIDLYVERHDGQAVTCDDFVKALEDASGIDLSLFRRWYSQSGTPTVKFELQQERTENSLKLILQCKQVNLPTADQKEKLPLHIPIDFSLLADDGTVLEQLLLELKAEQQTYEFEFKDVKAVTPVFNRGFSAPVQIAYSYGMDELIRIMKFEEDEYARWDATQQVYLEVLKSRVAQEESSKLESELKQALSYLFSNLPEDKQFAAELFSLPSFDALAAQYQIIQPALLTNAIEQLEKNIANWFDAEWLSLYQSLEEASTKNTNATDSTINKQIRSLKSVCLKYMLNVDSETQIRLAKELYRATGNMTDKLAVLAGAKSANKTLFNELMSEFEQQWIDEPLVMDKWFALHATVNSEETLLTIKNLMTHKAFNLENPNRTRSLVGAFVMRNPAQFHKQEGYAFLEDIIIQLNAVNPQVAANLITPLLSWRKYPESNQALMKQTLRRIEALESLSSDLYEKVQKALAEN